MITSNKKVLNFVLCIFQDLGNYLGFAGSLGIKP